MKGIIQSSFLSGTQRCKYYIVKDRPSTLHVKATASKSPFFSFAQPKEKTPKKRHRLCVGREKDTRHNADVTDTLTRIVLLARCMVFV